MTIFYTLLAVIVALLALWAGVKAARAFHVVWFGADGQPERVPLTAVHPETRFVQMASFHGKAAKSAEAFKRGPRDGGRAA